VSTALLVVCGYFILAEFLQDSAPGLIVLGTFLVVGFSIVLMPSPRTKRPYKVVFLAVSVVSAGFTIGLYSGLLESVTLLDDSYIDVSRSQAILHLQNNGLTDFTVHEFKLGNVSFTFEYRPFSANRLSRGESRYFVIYFVGKSLAVDETQQGRMGGGWLHLLVNEELTPSTFQDGVSYPVVLTTSGLLRHRFDIEARHTLDEELDLEAYATRFESQATIVIRINNTGSYYSYIYSIEVAGVTFICEPPATVTPQGWWYDPPFNVLYLSFPKEPGLSSSSNMGVGEIYATPTPQLSMLVEGETYEILVRTMADKLYTTNVTV
jgi:hypothetical protein